MPTPSVADDAARFSPQPDAAAFVHNVIADYLSSCEPARDFARRLRDETGTRFVDWIDHISLPDEPKLLETMADIGFQAVEDAPQIWRHPGAIFPAVRIHHDADTHVALKVESVADFAATHNLRGATEGEPLSQFRRMTAWRDGEARLQVVERHGFAGFEPIDNSDGERLASVYHLESFRRRVRDFDDDAQGFDEAGRLIGRAADELGVDWAADLFFRAERDYWQRRNRAARVQKARQDALGVGWANHDHHTYRSSRASFTRLIAALEQLGFNCRERFYAGREAGWGAQVLEQPVCGVVIFADVDLSAEEVTGDFAHEPLGPRDELGTVGLWCKLHGEAFLQAGMHHLEAQFDFDAARKQLAAAGVNTMKPFTDMPHLKQAFTEGERWPVSESRIDASLRDGFITAEQAEAFKRDGALGSHLEILERNDGYKGFNQSGINDIILETDPRRQAAATA